MTRDELMAFIERRFELLTQRQGASAYREVYADDAVVESPIAGTITGPVAIAEVGHILANAFPDREVTIEDLLMEGDRAVFIARFRGTHAGEFLGMPKTDRPVEWRVVHLVQIQGQKIVRERRFYDFTGLLIQVGVLKAKPA